MMDGSTSNDSNSSTLSPVSSPSSSSSIVFVDLYGKRRQIAKVQVLEREIELLQDEIKSLAELELVSTCCKELEDFVEARPDPLIAVRNQAHGRSKNFWKNLRKKICSMLWCCCCCGCCNTKVCCTCRSRTKDCCCWCNQEKTRTSHCCKCPNITCHCSYNPSCPKCSACCCCKTCPCF